MKPDFPQSFWGWNETLEVLCICGAHSILTSNKKKSQRSERHKSLNVSQNLEEVKLKLSAWRDTSRGVKIAESPEENVCFF